MELTEKEFYDKIGEKIKALRERADHKQEDFSKLLDLSRASIVNIEKGRQTPSFFLIWKLSKIFNIKIEYFLDEDDSAGFSQETLLPAIHKKKLSEIAKNELEKSPDSFNKLRNFVIENLSST